TVRRAIPCASEVPIANGVSHAKSAPSHALTRAPEIAERCCESRTVTSTSNVFVFVNGQLTAPTQLQCAPTLHWVAHPPRARTAPGSRLAPSLTAARHACWQSSVRQLSKQCPTPRQATLVPHACAALHPWAPMQSWQAWPEPGSPYDAVRPHETWQASVHW